VFSRLAKNGFIFNAETVHDEGISTKERCDRRVKDKVCSKTVRYKGQESGGGMRMRIRRESDRNKSVQTNSC
jgi:hypothetical protein